MCQCVRARAHERVGTRVPCSSPHHSHSLCSGQFRWQRESLLPFWTNAVLLCFCDVSVGTNGGLYLRLNQRVNYFSDWKICPYLDILLQIIRKNCEKTVLSSHSRQTLHTQQQLPQELWRYMENNEVLVLSCTPYTFEGTGNLRKNLVAIYSILMDLF